MPARSGWRCAICLVVLTLTLKELLSHINARHGSSPNFHIVCGIDDCPRSYSVYHSFYQHVKTRHETNYNNNHNNQTQGIQEIGAREFPPDNHDGGGTESDLSDDSMDAVPGPVTPQEIDGTEPVTNVEEHQYQRTASQFLLRLKGKNGLSQACIDDTVAATRNLFSSVLNGYKETCKRRITESAADEDDIMAVLDEVEKQFSDPFLGLGSAYLQHQYVQKELNYVEPIEKKLGETIIRVRKKNKYLCKTKPDNFVYILLLKTLEQWCSNERIYGMLTNGHTHAPDGYLIDICDGDVCKQHAAFDGDKSLGILIYFDDIDICNPIGSKSSIHKLSMFYYLITNIDRKFRSKVVAINVFAIADTSLVKKYGIDKIIQPFLSDLQILENGYEFMSDSDLMRLHGAALLGVIGDTPASHSLGGYKEGVGAAFCPCRHCECTHTEVQTTFNEDDCQMRSKESYTRQCNEINRAEMEYMKTYLRTSYGINRESILANVNNFDVTRMLPEDVMHVMLEGVVQYEVKEILKHYIQDEHDFTLNEFNSGIKSFHLSYFDVKDRPSEIMQTTLASDDNRLRQDASQMHVLLKMLPFLLLNLGTDKDDQYFAFLRELVDIMHILCSPVISYGTISNLKGLITDHLKNFKDLFPNLNILPKQHYLIHFPTIIKDYGPPCRYSCMRFESKHQEFKRLAKHQNFLNVSKSMAIHYQKQQCSNVLSDNPSNHPLFQNEKKFGPSVKLSNEKFDYFVEKFSSFYGNDEIHIRNIYHSKHVTLNGTRYEVNQCYLAVETDGIHPTFGLIVAIYVVNNSEVFFELKLYDTILHDEYLKAYEIQEFDMPAGTILKRPSECIDYNCYGIVMFDSKMYVPVEVNLDDAVDMFDSHGRGIAG